MEEKMKYNFKFGILMVVLFTISGVVAANAGNFGSSLQRMGKGGPGMAGIWHQLDLTEEQKASLREIVLNYREAAETIREGIPAAKEKLMEALHAEPMNEDAVRIACRGASAVREELTVLRAKIFAEFSPLLTAEQKETLETAMAERLERMSERMERRQEKIDAWLGVEGETE
jgi:Spy/CpxP family protein refolding chaperone